MYLLTAAAFGGTSVIFTFLAPILTEVTSVDTTTISIALIDFWGRKPSSATSPLAG